MSFQDTLATRRHQAGFTVRQLATASGLSISKISRIENGLADASREDLHALARALHADEAEWRELAGMPPAGFDDARERDPQSGARFLNAMWAVFEARLAEAGVPARLIPEVMAQLDTETIGRILRGEEDLQVRGVRADEDVQDIIEQTGDANVMLLGKTLKTMTGANQPWETTFATARLQIRTRGTLTGYQRAQLELAGQLIRSIVEDKNTEES